MRRQDSAEGVAAHGLRAHQVSVVGERKRIPAGEEDRHLVTHRFTRIGLALGVLGEGALQLPAGVRNRWVHPRHLGPDALLVGF